MPYIANPDIQPGKKGGVNQAARENQNRHNGVTRINTGRKRDSATSEDTWADGANLISAYSVGSDYSGSAVLLNKAITERNTSPARIGEIDPKYLTAGVIPTPVPPIPTGYGLGGYGLGGYGL